MDGVPAENKRRNNDPPQYCWMVEECILAAIDKKSIKCPNHGEIALAHVAPDVVCEYYYSFKLSFIISLY